MPEYKVVFTDYFYPNNDKEIEIINRLGNVEIIDCTKIKPGGITEEDDVISYIKDADAIIVQFAAMTRKVIQQLVNCRIICRYAIGVDSIDLEAAKEKGIVVANVPDYCIEEVSDTAIAHMLNCIRRIPYADKLVRTNEWDYEKIKPIRRFSNLTVGLLAFGNIAKRVAEKLRPFGVKILAYDPYIGDQRKYGWVEFVELKELLSQSDIISVHAPLTNETHHMIDEDKFNRMKKGVIVINTSRGGLVDENALAQAIENNKVAAAGLDVLETEDSGFYTSVLLKYPDRVFISPHIAWYSEEAIVELQTKTALNVYEMLKNGKPLYPVFK